MKLEDLAGALTELKEKLFVTISEDAAAEASEDLLTELRKRIIDKQHRPAKKKVIAIPSTKLNEQQSKFLKEIPTIQKQDEVQKRADADSIQLKKSGNGYTIGIDSELPQQIKNLAIANDADAEQYLNTLTENAKKILE